MTRKIFYISIILIIYLGLIIEAYNHGYNKGALHTAKRIEGKITDSFLYGKGYNDGWNYCYSSNEYGIQQ